MFVPAKSPLTILSLENIVVPVPVLVSLPLASTPMVPFLISLAVRFVVPSVSKRFVPNLAPTVAPEAGKAVNNLPEVPTTSLEAIFDTSTIISLVPIPTSFPSVLTVTF